MISFENNFLSSNNILKGIYSFSSVKTEKDRFFQRPRSQVDLTISFAPAPVVVKLVVGKQNDTVFINSNACIFQAVDHASAPAFFKHSFIQVTSFQNIKALRHGIKMRRH
jgi:hypothetical protein